MNRRPEIKSIVDAWASFSGVEEHLARSRRGAVDEAARMFAFLSAQPARAREVLSAAGDNGVLAALLVRMTLEQLRGGGVHDAPRLIEWIAFVGDFCADRLYRPHAAWLKGCLALLEPQAVEDGIPSLQRAMDEYQTARAPRDLCSTAAIALALLKARLGDVAGSRSLLEHGRSLALTTARHEWTAAIEDLTWRCERRWRAVEILAADPTAPTGAIVGLGGFDAELAIAMEARAMLSMARQDVAQTVAAARAVDRVLRELGETRSFLREAAELASRRQQAPIAEALLRAARSTAETGDRLRLVRDLRIARRFEEAESQLRAVLTADPQSAEAHGELGLLRVRQRRCDEALVELATALELGATNPQLKVALERLSPSRLRGAELDAATGVLSLDDHAFAERGPAGLAALMVAVMIRAKPREAVKRLAELQAERGQAFADQVRELLFPRNSPYLTGHHAQATRLFMKQAYREAIAEYRLAIAEDPENAMAYMGLGDCHYHLEEFEIAAAFFEESIAIEPATSTYRFLGDAHYLCGRPDDAIRAYRAALELDPSYEAARASIAQVESARRSR